MILFYMRTILALLLLTSVTGYIFVVIKEKIALKNNMIIIDKKSVTQEHIDETDAKEFLVGSFRVKSGDEIKVIFRNNRKIEGIIIGAVKRDNSILLVTHRDEIKRLKVDKIKKLKIISKYGRFFKFS